MSRLIGRRLVLQGVVGISLSGCTNYDYGCSSGNDIGLAHCRQAQLRASMISNATVGLIIGAALGAAFAAGFGANPAAGALIGAVAGGTTGLAKAYFEHELRQARNDLDLAIQGIRSDIEYDSQKVLTLVNDNRIATRTLIQAFQQNNMVVMEALEKARQAKHIKHDIEINVRSFQGAKETYDEVRKMAPQRYKEDIIEKSLILDKALEIQNRERISQLKILGDF